MGSWGGARGAAFLLSVTVACARARTEPYAAITDAATPLTPAAPSAPDGATDAAIDAGAAPSTRTGPLPGLEVQEVEATGLLPKGAFLSSDRKVLFVTNFGQLDKTSNVTMYDADTLAPRGRIDLPAVVVEGVVSPDDRTLYLSSFWGHSVLFVDLATRSIRAEIKTGNHPKVLALSRDGRTLFAANWSGESVTQIDTEARAVVRTLRVGKNPRGLALTSKGVLYAANFFDASIDVFEGGDFAVKRRMKACTCPRHLALSPDEQTLYVSCLHASELHAIDVATSKVVHRATLGASPKSIAVAPDGRYVFSADYGLTRSVSVVDTADWTSRTFTVPGMDRGSGIAVAADGEHAFVTGWYDAHVYRVGFERTGGHPANAKEKIRHWIHRPFQRDPGDSGDSGR